ncbi:MAG: hypothetical protein ACFBWO_09385 [Paracoccaceae bacterium]
MSGPETIAVSPPVARLDEDERPRWRRLGDLFAPSAAAAAGRPPGGAPRVVAIEAWLSPVDAHEALRLSLPLVPLAAREGEDAPPWHLAPPFDAGTAGALASLAAGEEPAVAPEALSRFAAASGFANAREDGFFDRVWLAPACLAFGYQHAGETLAALDAGRLDPAVASARVLSVLPLAGADPDAVAADVRGLVTMIAGRLGGPRPVLAPDWSP